MNSTRLPACPSCSRTSQFMPPSSLNALKDARCSWSTCSSYRTCFRVQEFKVLRFRRKVQGLGFRV
eukprot:1096299-Rhodomonas_salina.2